MLQQADPQAIAHIKALDQFTVWAMPQAPISENTIDIEHKQIDRR